eukprot:TRINITY_DN14049_c0_g1_i1.p1 TRINITY_DN14049_c0_g1~~TRINITY_DN14049_c0_g1_i1.p1  ORF type:complete len:693 (+),score=118.08 TRINITY_DN14049_c0_g1_i1:40-2079(+)
MEPENYVIGVIIVTVYLYFAASKRFYGLICRTGIIVFYIGAFAFLFGFTAQVLFAACRAKIQLAIFNLISISVLLCILVHSLCLTVTMLPTLLKKYWNIWWFITDLEENYEYDSMRKTLLRIFYPKPRWSNVKAYDLAMIENDATTDEEEALTKAFNIPFYHNWFIYRGMKKKRDLVLDADIYQFMNAEHDIILRFLDRHPLMVWIIHMSLSVVYSSYQLISNGKSGIQSFIYCVFANITIVAMVLAVSLFIRTFKLFLLRGKAMFLSKDRDDVIKKIFFIVNVVVVFVTSMVWLFTDTFKTKFMGIFFLFVYSFMIFPYTHLLSSFTGSWTRLKVILLDVFVLLFFWVLFRYVSAASYTDGYVLEAGDSLSAANKLISDCNINYPPLAKNEMPSAQEYTFCHDEIVEGSNFTKVDMLAFAKLSYVPYAYKYYRKLSNYDFENEKTVINHFGAYYNVYFSKKMKLTIINVRGTLSKVDWNMDFQMFVEALIVQIIENVTPVGSYLPEAFKNVLMKILQFSTEIMAFDDVDYFPALKQEVYPAVKRARERGDMIYFVGHSLGGALANLLAGYYKEQSVSVSPVGSLLTRTRYDINFETMLLSNEMFIPTDDFIPMIDKAYGNVHTILCNGRFDDIMYCHHLGRTMREIGGRCSNQDMYDYGVWDLEIDPDAMGYNECRSI